jgi:hypothetical protein
MFRFGLIAQKYVDTMGLGKKEFWSNMEYSESPVITGCFKLRRPIPTHLRNIDMSNIYNSLEENNHLPQTSSQKDSLYQYYLNLALNDSELSEEIIYRLFKYRIENNFKNFLIDTFTYSIKLPNNLKDKKYMDSNGNLQVYFHEDSNGKIIPYIDSDLQNKRKHIVSKYKSVWRWTNKGAVPRRIGMKGRVAQVLSVDESEIWPALPQDRLGEDREVTEEVVTVWAHRADTPKARWWAMLSGAEAHIDLLGYAMQFLPEDHSQLDWLLIEKAATGCCVRIALANPESPHVAERDEEEGLGGTLPARIRTTIDHFRPLFGVEGIDLRFHQTRMYNSVFRGDDAMFVTPHLHGLKGYRAPLLHIRRAADDGMFDGFLAHFERIWTISQPIPSP